MTSRRREQADLADLAEWIMERRQDYPPLEIVRVATDFDTDADGETNLFVTLFLNPPREDGPWSTSALLEFSRAVATWAYDAGYDHGPHVHLRDARLADAG